MEEDLNSTFFGIVESSFTEAEEDAAEARAADAAADSLIGQERATGRDLGSLPGYWRSRLDGTE